MSRRSVRARRTAFYCLLLALHAGVAAAQTPPIVGIRENTPRTHALTNIRIVQGPGRVIERGTVVLRDGVIEAVGKNADVPDDARVWDCAGLTVYAGFIDLYTSVGVEKEDDDDDDEAGAGYWNRFVTPEKTVIEDFEPKPDDLQSLRSLGFTCALVVPASAVISGEAALVHLGDGGVNEQLMSPRVAQCMSLEHRFTGYQNPEYPTALMGRITLIRQALLDAQWYAEAQRAYAKKPSQTKPESNDALAALAADLAAKRPVIFEVNDDLNLLRAQKLADEFDLTLWIRGSGHEYRVTDALRATNTPVVLPVNYPKAPSVTSLEEALDVTLEQLQHWDAAPANAYVLEQARIPFAFTTHGLKDRGTFHAAVRKAMEHGLSADAALAALTTTPATMLGRTEELGTIDKGRTAHLVVTDGELFAKETKVIRVWVAGDPYDVNPRPEVDPRGTWALHCDAFPSPALEITGDIGKLKGKLDIDDSTTVSLDEVTLDHRRLVITFDGGDLNIEGVVRMSGAVRDEALNGRGQLPDGSWFAWQATPADRASDKSKEGKEDDGDADKGVPALILSSYGAYGLGRMPEPAKHVIVKGATIWTCGPDGILNDADLLVSDGRVRKIGRDIKAPKGAVVIDGKGKHVTPGLIDCHSHSGVSGSVNEFGQTVSSEVRIRDVIDPRQITLYRELAGGLTVANVLHGSANPIGGQNAIIKLRWGARPEDMLIDGAPEGIKFALGENVKRSNWGDRFTDRYPQTRMGVEQIIRDRFEAALDYERAWKEYRKGDVPPRRDLELEALLEVLQGKRMVHCHSYRQDEILMLIRVAEDFGFQIGTFQHVLEGYKIAEAIAAHGAGASTFTDWWAYKFEVYDAIPYNGALMHENGVVVSFNSDSGELARRMNLEATKAVKYGGVPEADALKFVTLYPARQLGIDERVGSLEPGKDGDFVVWSGHPLSTYSRCEQTWIEGRNFFHIETDKQMREDIAAERARLIQKVLAAGDSKSRSKKSRMRGTHR